MSSFKKAVGCFKLRREIKTICVALSGQKPQGDVLRLSVNGSEVTLPAKIDTGIKLNVSYYFANMRVMRRVYQICKNHIWNWGLEIENQ